MAGSDVPETVNAFTSGNLIVLEGDEVLLGGGAQCTPNPMPTRLDCQPAPTLTASLLGGEDRIDASMLTGANLVADGGLGGDYILDGTGNDTLSGGPGGDVWRRTSARTRSAAAMATTRPTTASAARRSRSVSTGTAVSGAPVRTTPSAPTSRARSAAPATT